MKIIVRGTNWVGDAVMQIPALRYLRQIFPDAKITLCTRRWAEGIFCDADFIDDLLITNEEGGALRQQIKSWKKHDFDLAILFTNSFQTALIAKLGGARKRFGYANEGRSFLLSNPIAKPEWKNQRHEIFYYLNLVAEVEQFFFGQRSTVEPRFDLQVSAARREQAQNILLANGVDLSKKIFAFCPGSTNSRAKRWQAESYARLADLISGDFGAQVILMGDQSELDVSKKVSELADVKPLILTGKTSLAEATAVLSVCDLLVSNDTGPAHLAAALGTRTIVIFGPTNPLTTQPIGAEIIRRDVSCAPCMLRDCPIDHPCMRLVKPADVFEMIISKGIF